jgi:hypothetical protein
MNFPRGPLRWICLLLAGGVASFLISRSVEKPVAPIAPEQPDSRVELRASLWRQVSARNVPVAEGVSFHAISVERNTTRLEVLACRFEESVSELVVIDNGPGQTRPRYGSLADAIEQTGGLAGANGGFFDPASFAPNGLMVSSGKRVRRFDRFNWAEGVFAVRSGQMSLQHRDAFKIDGSVTQLLQIGPWLVRKNIPYSGFGNDGVAARTFLATDGKGGWMLGHARSSTLHELAEILRADALRQVVDVAEALNLDGGPSSGFWVRTGTGETVDVPTRSSVRNFVALRKRR